MANEHAFQDVLVLLVALLIAVPLFQRLKLGSTLAYLAIGLALGPAGFGLMERGDATLGFAELGVVFLLFSVGLEISIDRLKLFGRRIYLLAVTQIVATTVVLGAAATLAGFTGMAALVVGGSLTFSSTAVVLQLLSERGLMAGQLGRSAIAVLLLQDLAVAPMFVLVTAGTGNGEGYGDALAWAAIKFVAFAMIVAVIERALLRPLFKLAAQQTESPEVFAGATLLLVLGVGKLSEMLGLSMALGAFLAGLIVADTEYRHQVAADIQPFRGLLLGLFFASVGIQLDVAFAARHIGTIAGLVAALVLIKGLVLTILGMLLRLPPRRALALGALLAQGSEFAFVLLPAAANQRLLDAASAQQLTVAVGISMLLTPITALLVDRYRLAASAPRRSSLGDLQRERRAIGGHVVIAGFGQVGMAVARFLVGERVPVVVLDLSPKRVAASRERGLPVFYGNASRLDVLRAARLDQAQALVIAVPEAAAAERIAGVARRAFPRLRIFTRAPDEEWVDRLKAAGADAVVPESVTTALDLAERVILVHAPQEQTPMPP